MKKNNKAWIVVLVYLSLVCLYAYAMSSCNETKKTEPVIMSSSDSVLAKSQMHLDTATIVQKKSDSITHKVVEKKAKEIRFLKRLITVFKKERAEIVTEKVIYKTDTVFIETEKNFWGKKKTKTSVKSDSTIVENTDSTVVVIDSLDHN